MTQNRLSVVMACLACLLAIGCTATPTPPQLRATPTVENTPTPHYPATDTPGPSPTALPTYTPTPGSRVIPVVPLAPDGPWLVFQAASERGDNRSNLWATNADGTGYTKLIDEHLITYAIQPGRSLKEGVLVAYVTLPEFESRDLTLKLIHLPDRQTQTVTALIHDREGQPPIDFYNAWSAIQDNGLVWSPDGQQLAFVAQIDGPTMDVYHYDVAAQSIHRLSSGEDQATRLMWTKDQRWIVHQGFQFVGMGGPDIDGMWAAGVDGRGATTLYDAARQTTQPRGSLMVFGWLDDFHILLTNWQYETLSAIQAVDIRTGEAETILTAAFANAAVSASRDTWLLSTPYFQQGIIPLRLWRDGVMTDVPGHDITQVGWSETFGEFVGSGRNAGQYTISLSGEVADMPLPVGSLYSLPSITPSPDGQWWAWYAYNRTSQSMELLVGKPKAVPVLVEVPGGVTFSGEIIWSPDSQRLLLFSEKGLWAAQQRDFKPVRVVDGSYVEYWSAYKPQWVY